MSKYVKNLISDHLRERLEGVNDALLVNVIGLSANKSSRLRATLDAKKISLIAVKNSLAARACAGTPLAAMFEDVSGTTAICWGSDDIVSLAKEITKLAEDEAFAPFGPRGGVVDGERLSPEQVKAVSKWPSRREQLSILLGQILSPGANLSSQLISAGGALASQIKQKGEGEEEGEAPAPEALAPEATAPEAAAPEATAAPEPPTA